MNDEHFETCVQEIDNPEADNRLVRLNIEN